VRSTIAESRTTLENAVRSTIAESRTTLENAVRSTKGNGHKET